MRGLTRPAEFSPEEQEGARKEHATVQIEETMRERVLYLFAEECLAGGPHRWVRRAAVQCAECGAQPRPDVAA